jgi:hypothetical protein
MMIKIDSLAILSRHHREIRRREQNVTKSVAHCDAGYAAKQTTALKERHHVVARCTEHATIASDSINPETARLSLAGCAKSFLVQRERRHWPSFLD